MAGVPKAEDPKGRAKFRLESGEEIRFDGSNGFLVKRAGISDRYVTLQEIMKNRSENR
jgi:hypothetical protein